MTRHARTPTRLITATDSLANGRAGASIDRRTHQQRTAGARLPVHGPPAACAARDRDHDGDDSAATGVRAGLLPGTGDRGAGDRH